MKITFMGAGSTVFARNVLGDCMCTPALQNCEIALYDIDEKRLEDSRIILSALNQNVNEGRSVIKTYLGVENRKDALRDATFVVNAIQVGGYEPCTVTDFEIPKKYGLKQTIADTLGIGGIMRGLRTIPVLEGFARDMEFTLDSQTQDTLWFSIVSNETTMENYPFTFRLEVGYQLKGTEVTVLWNVINTDTKEMYFSIGAHPAFFTSMTLEAGSDTDHLHVGDNIEGTFTCYRVTENAMALEDDTLVLPRDLPLTADLFSRDAIISKDDQASRLALAYPDGQEYVVMQFDEPIFGLWSPTSDAPFVCLEPWHGRCDADDFTGTLQERAYERMLEVGGVFNGVYTIGLPLE